MYGEPEAQTRCGIHDTIHAELRRIICVPTRRYLWVPADEITFVPALSDTIYGDGRALYSLATLNSRPAFYVIRACSSWEESNWYSGPKVTFGEMIYTIYDDLENQFGTARLDSEEDDPDLIEEGYNPWPALDDENGSSWGQMDWPEQFVSRVDVVRNEFGWRRHTLLKSEYAAEDQFGQWATDGGAQPTDRRFWR